METEKQNSSTNPAQISTYIILLAVFLVTCVFFYLYQRKRTSRRGILLTGLCDSGKTVIFSHLVHGRYADTQTSMKENHGEFVTKNGSLRIIDIPGYERLRGKYFDQYKSTALGIAYVIDSVTLQKDVRDAAEFLYTILIDPAVNNTSNFLIVCNKQDLALAKGMGAVKSILEKELNALRVTKSSQLQSVDGKTAQNVILGKSGKNFTFDSLATKVEFVEVSASSDSTDVGGLHKWLTGLCA